MRLPFAPPLAPMLSSAADTLPGGEGWQFEPELIFSRLADQLNVNQVPP